MLWRYTREKTRLRNLFSSQGDRIVFWIKITLQLYIFYIGSTLMYFKFPYISQKTGHIDYFLFKDIFLFILCIWDLVCLATWFTCPVSDIRVLIIKMYVFVVPGPVPVNSLQGTSFENKIFLNWKEPLDPNGIITQYEVLREQGS